jgi:secondary thiamine-phosphate synthase enzyme
MLTIEVQSKEREQLIDITDDVAKLVHGVDEGVVWLHCPHTTAALTIQENADPALRVDYLEHLGKLVPQPGFRHDEGNADAHIKS